MHAVVVVPCLNEQSNVAAVGRSLGFGLPDGAGQASLVMVDNGSTDGTPRAMAEFADRSERGRVVVVSEPEQGFVPARHRGAVEARRLARIMGFDEDEVLLVQADADTRYGAGYVGTMLEASMQVGGGAVLEGVSEAPEPPARWSPYYDLERSVDPAVSAAFAAPEQDVVVDDKIAAFRLSDYFGWGGHRREYGLDGDEILAETTRLFIAAKLRGASRHRVGEAVAVTSQRRVFEDPAAAFATAGYPRGLSWKRRTALAKVGSPPTDLAPLVRLAPVRAAHLLGMFGFLPAWFAALAGTPASGDAALDAAYLEALQGAPDADLIAEKPGALLDWAMSRTSREVAAVLDASGAGMPVGYL